ncbi:MAG TPA: CAP domain-containing protein [Saprospiraceae bacterium]|nr:CAP domain-containing protein [Saprospiraceae bacterium]
MSIVLSILLLFQFTNNTRDFSKENALKTVNELRAKGCRCGNTYMPPVQSLQWNNVLEESAMDHAKEMENYHYFSHYGVNGLDIGKRISKYDYPWHFVGENIGEGQTNFQQVFLEWKASETHCKMMMNPKMEDMAVAHFGNYWVQHFGKKIPKGKKRKE